MPSMFGKAMSGFGMGSSARMGGGTTSMNPMASSRPSLQQGNPVYGGTSSSTMRGSPAGRSPTPQAQQSRGIAPSFGSSIFRAFQQPQQPSFGFNPQKQQPQQQMRPMGRQQQIGSQLAPFAREIQQRMTPGSPTYGTPPQQNQMQPRPYMPQPFTQQPQGGSNNQPLQAGGPSYDMSTMFRSMNPRGPTGLGGGFWGQDGRWVGPE